MSTGKPSFLDRMLGRLDKLDLSNVQLVINRLARERAFLENLFNAIEDGVLVLDPEGKLLYCNNAAKRLLALPQDAEGNRIIDWLPELDWNRLQALCKDRTTSSLRYEFELQFPRHRFLRAYASPIEIDPGNVTGILLILHDETDVRQKTIEVVEAERFHAITLLAGTVAHEIGNPLNAISIHLQLVERELKKTKTALSSPSITTIDANRTEQATHPPTDLIIQALNRMEQFLGVAKSEIARLDQIIRQFLSGLRPASPKLKDANLNMIVAKALELLRPEIEDHGLTLETRLMSSIPNTKVDPEQIQQVMINLLKNAIQATPRGGKIIIETGDEPEWVWVSVCDTGKGMTKETMANLFHPFFTTHPKGTGLGLMIVQRIVRAHGGRIEVESQPGRGTTFKIWLPLAEPRPRLLDSRSSQILTDTTENTSVHSASEPK